MNYIRNILTTSNNLPQCSIPHSNPSKTCVSLQTGIPDTPGRRRVFSTADGQNLYVADNDFNNFSAIRTLFEDAGPCVAGSPHSILTLPVFITSDVLDKLVLLARCRTPSGTFNKDQADSLLGSASATDLLKMIEACVYLDARHLARECARRLAGILDGKSVKEMRVLLEKPVEAEIPQEMTQEVDRISKFVLS
ncbi:hypothetical protein Q1695_011197 [Nippostrongylus brasiliensis]|nr:hypothetical protein Q1695_011197 [Nippostrongylus brasiliensis]